MVFNDIEGVIFSKFREEYYESDYRSYGKFLESLDLGIAIKLFASTNISWTMYRVTDEHKWMLNKIKYGF